MTAPPCGSDLDRVPDEVDGPPSPVVRVAWITALTATAALSVAIFVRLTAPDVDSDILAHARIALLEARSGRWFTYTLWTPVLIGLSGEGHLMSLRTASIVLLTVAVLCKLVMARRALAEWSGQTHLAVVLAAGVVLATPVLGVGDPSRNSQLVSAFPRGSIYLGRISATVWHNSTTIASVPVILLAAVLARRALERRTPKSVLVMGGALALSTLIKPNWALASVPVFAVVLVVRQLRSAAPRRDIVALLFAMAGPTVAVLALQLVLVRSDPFIIPSAFSIDPLEVWRFYARSPLRAWIQSLLFPLMATATTLVARRRGDWWLGCCWAITIVATIQLAVLGERNRTSGALILDGNWFWGPHAAALVLFLAAASSLAAVAREVRAPAVRVLVAASWTVFGLHVLTGVVYVVRLFQLRGGFAT